MTLFISLLKVINVVGSDANIFLWIAVFVADVAAANRNGIKTLLANVLCAFPIKGNFINGAKCLLQNPSHCPILNNWVFDNFILAEKIVVKALQSLETSVLVYNKCIRKIIFIIRITSSMWWNFQSHFLFQILIY